ncbi:putative glycosyltransferase [Vibrio ezurae NBRC 102218]|uniref:Putative glycosyltransferase n=2 Tax=Vibrio ezurae TaxID=252583 RepID=U3AI96_9VIBR|nr:putative glycosyltransferase [Vibrio ezurae NBRC 102218]
MFIKVVNWVDEHFVDVDIRVLLISSKGINYSKIRPHIHIDVLDIKSIFRSIIKVKRYIKDYKPDIVFSTITQLNIMLSLIKLVSKNFVLISRETNVITEEFKTNNYPFYYLWLYKLSLKVSDFKVFQSIDMLEDAIKVSNLDNYKIINNCVDSVVDRPKMKKKELDTLNLICIGRLEKQKGFDRLIKSIQNFYSGFELKLDIYGTGSESESLEKLAKDLNCGYRVNFKGYDDKVMSIINEYDLFILSSLHEGFPNAMIETLSYGVPVWSVDCKGGVNEIINDTNGRVFRDTDELVQNLVRFKEYSYDRDLIWMDATTRFSESKARTEYLEVIKRFL